MQVEQIAAEGLKREFKVTVPADEIQSRVQTRLQKLAQTIRLPGFRPGKAPLPLLRKQYGRAILHEVVEEAVDEGSKKAINDNQLRPALRPQVEPQGEFGEGKDLEFALKLEVLPEVPLIDLEGITLTRLTAEPPEDAVDEAIKRFAESRQTFAPPAEPRPAQEGDQLLIDFEGRIDGEPFEGGTGTDFTLRLGAKSMVPGFEEGLVGAMPGETREVKITFPQDYSRTEVAGKDAVFTVTVKDVRAPVEFTLDDAWAGELGFESLNELKETFKRRFSEEYQSVSRAKLKRALLDQLAETYTFDVPQGMVDLEFEAIWKQLQDEMQRTGATYEEAGKSEEELRAEYRAIAERRVRLGLILSDVGTRNEIKVENEELHQAVVREAMRFTGQERKVFEFFRNNPAALEQVRAPLFEDKVCDFIFGKAKVTEQPVSIEELMRDPDAEEETKPAGDTQESMSAEGATAEATAGTVSTVETGEAAGTSTAGEAQPAHPAQEAAREARPTPASTAPGGNLPEI